MALFRRCFYKKNILWRVIEMKKGAIPICGKLNVKGTR
jgi:hypothetical protein